MKFVRFLSTSQHGKRACGVAIRRYRDCTVFIGAVNASAEALERFSGRGGGVSEHVVAPHRDDRVPGMHGGNKHR